MTLIEEAERAEQISNAFTQYLGPNPEHAQNINASVAKLAALSWALREISKLLGIFGDNLWMVEEDLKLVHDKVCFTLGDIWQIIGALGGNSDGPLTSEDFRRNWKIVTKYCRISGGLDLFTRLDTYERFLLALCKTIQRQPSETGDLGILRRSVQGIATPGVKSLLEQRDGNSKAANDVVTGRAAGKVTTRRSYERERNGGPMSPSESGSSTSPYAAMHAPSPPTSPTQTFSTVSQISSIDREIEHWALRVFKTIPSWTPLPTSDIRSQHHEIPGEPSFGHPGDSFEEVVAMSFPPDPPGLRIGILYKRRDWRAKIIAQYKDRRGRDRIACLPLNMLKVFREGPLLRLCRRTADGHNVAWLTLKFSAVERLVLFACTFLSMRAHDGKKPVRPVDDWELDGEVVEYAGKTQDNGHTHALRICRDKVSKAIRLQASIRGGQMDSTPVWTAFITHHITSRTWCQRLEKTTVCLRELCPHSFSPNYEFNRSANGAFVLHFESKEDAKDFVAQIESLGRQSRRAKH